MLRRRNVCVCVWGGGHNLSGEKVGVGEKNEGEKVREGSCTAFLTR